MWRHYDILSGGGKNKRWELNQNWFAAPELSAFLQALIACDKRYAGRAASATAKRTRR